MHAALEVPFSHAAHSQLGQSCYTTLEIKCTQYTRGHERMRGSVWGGVRPTASRLLLHIPLCSLAWHMGNCKTRNSVKQHTIFFCFLASFTVKCDPPGLNYACGVETLENGRFLGEMRRALSCALWFLFWERWHLLKYTMHESATHVARPFTFLRSTLKLHTGIFSAVKRYFGSQTFTSAEILKCCKCQAQLLWES